MDVVPLQLLPPDPVAPPRHYALDPNLANEFHRYPVRRVYHAISPFEEPSRSLPRLPLPKVMHSGTRVSHIQSAIWCSNLCPYISSLAIPLWSMPGSFLRYHRCQDARAKIARDAEDVGGSDAESETSSVASGMHANNHNLLEQSESSSPRGLLGRRSWQLA